MAIADYPTYKTALTTPRQRLAFTKQQSAAGGADGQWVSFWTVAGFPAAATAPGAGGTCTRSTAGAMPIVNPSTVSRLVSVAMKASGGASAFGGMILVVDRLCHMSGLDATLTSAQTTNLPTAALPRYTDGVGVIPFLEVYTTIGTTGANATISYTNQAGTAGQTSQSVLIGGSTKRVAGLCTPLALAAGDTGCRAVASVTLDASTGTAGNFGITLVKPLLAIPCVGSLNGMAGILVADTIFGLAQQIPQIQTDACLAFMMLQSNTVATQIVGSLGVIEE